MVETRPLAIPVTDHLKALLPTDMTPRNNLPARNIKIGKGQNLLKRSFAVLGPGLITGAADDDPSGVSTYSVAGAAYGYATLWIALLTFPLMARSR
jgi:hypothetical protein